MSFRILKNYDKGEGVNQDEALRIAGARMLSNLEADLAIQTDYDKICPSLPCWTKTHIKYEAGATTAEVWNEGEKKHTKIHLHLNDGWYLPDKKYGIPSGEKSSAADPKARYLWRWHRDFDGLVVRLYDRFGDGRRYVDCFCVSDVRFGVCVRDGAPFADNTDWKAKYEVLLAKVRAVAEEFATDWEVVK